MTSSSMRDFWDRRAQENALFFVDSRLRYENPDRDRFWRDGERDLAHLLGLIERDVTRDDDVVEIGCGVGRLTRGLAAHARSVTALDVSGRMLELAAEYNPHLTAVEWVHGDGRSLRPLADGSASVCFSHVVFQHIPNPDVTLSYVREMGRVLRPGGWAGFQFSNDPEIHRRRPLRNRIFDAPGWGLGRGPRGQNADAWRGSAVDLSSIRRAATDVGLELALVYGEGTQWCVVRLDRS